MNYHLTEDSGLFSEEAGQQFNLDNGTTDIDFDTSPFNMPRTLKGTTTFNVPIELTSSSDTVNIVCTLRKWDGSTETDLVSATSADWTRPTTGDDNHTFQVNLTVPETHFAEGETLRATVVYKRTTGSGKILIGHDPVNRVWIGPNGTIDTTVFKIGVHFKIDL